MTDAYLVLFNISKKSNLGNLIRTANAFSVREVIFVGKRAFREFGAFGTSAATTKRHFYTLDEACEFLREQGCSICGVEITDEAAPVQSQPFAGSTAFMVGNEGIGLNEKQRAACDRFVFIPQYGTGASLNVNVATGIVLHHFAVWAGFEQSQFRDGKFSPFPLPATEC